MSDRRATTIFVLAVVAVLPVYLLRIDAVAGLFVDDAWYMMLAEAIASGQGYRLINSAAAQVLPAVPPGFALLLAPVVALAPGYPNYVLWMKLLLIAATMAAAVICWIDFVRHRGIPRADATLIVVASLLTPSVIFLATSAVMAEGIFMLLQIAAVIAVERTSRHDAGDHRSAAVAGVLAGAAMLVRSTGAALIAAALVHLVIARRWRQAFSFAAVLALCLLPWQLYAFAHAPTDEERASHGGTMSATYSQLLTSERLSDPSRPASPDSLINRAVQNARVVFTKDFGAVVVPSLYRGPDESGFELFSIGRSAFGSMGDTSGTIIVSIAVALICIIGWLASPRERFAMPGLLVAATVPMIVPVTGQTFRYLVPVAPYMLMFVWRGLRAARSARLVLLIVIGLHVLDNAGYIHQKMVASPPWITDWHDQEELLTWVAQNVPQDKGIVTTNPALIYLATGRRTVAIDSMPRKWDHWRAAGLRYVASTRSYSELPSASLGWRPRFRSSHGGLWVVEITDRQEARQH
jgi:hypothetical protein